MRPLRLPSAKIQCSVMGPLTVPPAIVVISTLSGSVEPLLWFHAPAHASLANVRFVGLVLPKQPLYSKSCDLRCTYTPSAPPDWADHCSTGGRRSPGKTVWSYG